MLTTIEKQIPFSFFTSDEQVDENTAIGGKAKNLYKLKALGIPVPAWIVIPEDVLFSFISRELILSENYPAIIEQISKIEIPSQVIEDIVNKLDAEYYAVRSSATDEDGNNYSFAGQFESHVYVTKEKLA